MKDKKAETRDKQKKKEDFNNLIGLGKNSLHKSYYKELQERVEDLESFKSLLNDSNEGYILIRAFDLHVIDYNRIAGKILNFESTKTPHLNSFFTPDKIELIQKTVNEKTSCNLFLQKDFVIDNQIQFYEINLQGSSIKNNNAIIFFHNITDRVKMESTIRRSLHEKEIMLKEIHHRVKNNFQIIISLLRLQSDTKEKECRTVFTQTQNRIFSMAIVHEMLYQSENLQNIDIAEYLNKLTNLLITSYQLNPSDIIVHKEIDPISIGIDQAIPLGIILNELITNSFIHGITLNGKCEITIEMKNEDNHFILHYKDKGPGLPEDFDIENSESLGVSLITTLTDQLDASIEIVNHKPLTYHFKIPISNV